MRWHHLLGHDGHLWRWEELAGPHAAHREMCTATLRFTPQSTRDTNAAGSSPGVEMSRPIPRATGGFKEAQALPVHKTLFHLVTLLQMPPRDDSRVYRFLIF